MSVKKLALALFLFASLAGLGLAQITPPPGGGGAAGQGCAGQATNTQLLMNLAGSCAGANLFHDAFGDYIFGSSDFSSTLPYMNVAANKFALIPNQQLAGGVNLTNFNSPLDGTDLNSISIALYSPGDSTTGKWNSQINFGAASSNGATSQQIYNIGAEGTCTSAANCGSQSQYDFFFINQITGHSLLMNTSANPDILVVPSPVAFTTSGSAFLAGPVQVTDTTDSNPFMFKKTAAGEFAPSATFVSIKAEAGTNAGTCKIVILAGTSATPVTLIDNVGGGC